MARGQDGRITSVTAAVEKQALSLATAQGELRGKKGKKKKGPPPPTRQQFLPQRRPDKTDTLEDLYPHLPLLCRPRDPFAFHSSPASIAARPVKAVKTRGGAGGAREGGCFWERLFKAGPQFRSPCTANQPAHPQLGVPFIPIPSARITAGRTSPGDAESVS